jgi:HD superfamily phosphodiesterase
VDLGYHPNESKRLLRLIYAALAGVEGVLLGEPKINSREIELLAKKITARTEELRPILS